MDTNSALRSHGRSTGEFNALEISKGDEGVVFLEILNDPLGTDLLKCAGRTLVTEGLRDGVACGEVLDDGGPARLGLGSYRRSDLVASGDGEAEVVGVVWEPLVPSIIGVRVARHSPVNAGLENHAVGVYAELVKDEGIVE